MPEENDALNEAPASATEGVEEPQGEPTPTNPVEELKAFMEARDLKSPDDLTGYVQDLGNTEQWKKQYGESRNEVGELRRQLEGLQAQVQQNQAYEPGYEQPINIGDVVEQKVEGVFQRMMQQQQQIQQRYLAERGELMKRPGWSGVQPHFDKALSDPQVQFALQNGTLTQESLYSRINDRVLTSKVNAMIENLPKGALASSAPNAETSDRTQQPIPEQEAKKQRIQKAIEDQDVDTLLEDLIPDNDAIVKY